jgi:two-component system NtrC family sensor kinase
MADGAEPQDANPTDLLGKAIESGVQLSRLYAEVNVSRRRLELAIKSANALNRLSRRLLGAETPEAIWREIYRACIEQVPVMSSSLLYREADGEPLQETELTGHARDPLLATMGERLRRFLGRMGEAAHLNEHDDDEVLRPIRAIEPEIRGMLIVPVQIRGDVEGAIVLYRGAGQPPFHMKDTRFLSSVANVAALGLGRALRERDIVSINRELEDRVRDRTARLSNALREIRRLNSTLEDRVQRRTADLDKANETLRETQEFLVQAEKMSSLARVAGGIAHEINNPMAYVQGNLKTLSDYVDEIQRTFRRVETALDRDNQAEIISAVRLAISDPGLREVREDLDGLVEETTEGATRVVKIAESMRKLAHIRATERVPVDIHEQIESAVSLLAPKLRAGVEIVRDFGEIQDVLGFPVLLSQIFLNIIDNASDAMDHRGRITIRTRPEEEGALVEISDNGPGIDEDTLPHIFEPFYTTKDVGKGTGLGLYTVYQIIERHGGVVNVDSEVGVGTTFAIHFLGVTEPVPAEATV